MSDSSQTRGQGELRGDFTRDTFDPAKHFSRVLMQQGRVQLDADWNEQTSILLHYLRTLAKDLIGPHGGPDDGFKITAAAIDQDGRGLKCDVTEGHYYVEGILCEAEQPSFTVALDFSLTKGRSYLLFLDVWEGHVSCHEDSDIAEVALKGPDTATRAEVLYQVRMPSLDPGDLNSLQPLVQTWSSATGNAKTTALGKIREFAEPIQDKLMPPSNANLRARARVAEETDGACTISPKSQFRGAENQLYRVEIQRGGSAWDGVRDTDNKQPAGNASAAATFKWSRDNGSVVFPVRTLDGDSVKLATLGPDGRRSLQKDDWVEIVDDDLRLQGRAGLLRQIQDIKSDEMTVVLSAPVPQTYDEENAVHPLLRRWDQPSSDGDPADNALLLKESSGEDASNWVTLEDGVQIQFPTPLQNIPNTYRAGDYWLIPARVATGDVIWPKDDNKVAKPQPPHGVEHHYAPLAVISLDGTTGKITSIDLRRKLVPPLAP